MVVVLVSKLNKASSNLDSSFIARESSKDAGLYAL
jgi:hypothetical protein